MENKELTIIQQKDLQKFNELKATAEEHILILSQIQITDNNSEAIATQQLSSAKAYVKHVESIRVEMKAPYLDMGKQIDTAAKTLNSPVDEWVEKVGKSLLAWKQAAQRKREEEANRLANLKAKIISYQTESILEINACKTVSPELAGVFKKRIAEFPADDQWGEFVAEAHEMKKVLMAHGKSKKASLEELAKATSKEEVEKIEVAQQIQEAEAIQATQEIVIEKADNAIAKVESQTTTNIRKDWKATVFDFNAIPREFLILDEKKVKEYMREKVAKGDFVSGQTYQEFGIQFKQEETLLVRS